jgi:hypothetical protein
LDVAKIDDFSADRAALTLFEKKAEASLRGKLSGINE